MTRPPPLFFSLLIALLSIISVVSASAPTFCKCTCFSNSTIIPLGPQPQQPPNNQPPPPSTGSGKDGSKAPPASSPGHLLLLSSRAASSSCAQCNRAFCQKYNLPICKDAEEKDIITSCFQRDSRKDQIIVWGFILGTAGLLGWAGVKKVVEGYEKNGRFVGSRVAGGGGGGLGGGLRGGQGQGQGQGHQQSGIFGRVVGIVSRSGNTDGGGGAGGGGGGGGLMRRNTGGSGQQQYTPLG